MLNTERLCQCYVIHERFMQISLLLILLFQIKMNATTTTATVIISAQTVIVHTVVPAGMDFTSEQISILALVSDVIYHHDFHLSS